MKYIITIVSFIGISLLILLAKAISNSDVISSDSFRVLLGLNILFICSLIVLIGFQIVRLLQSVKKEIRYYQIEYKALREVYKTIDINGETHEYQNILDAFEKLSKVEGFRFTAANNKNYELWLNVSLDKKKLPKPLQVNYFDTTWNMSSEKKIHKLGKLN